MSTRTRKWLGGAAVVAASAALAIYLYRSRSSSRKDEEEKVGEGEGIRRSPTVAGHLADLNPLTDATIPPSLRKWHPFTPDTRAYTSTRLAHAVGEALKTPVDGLEDVTFADIVRLIGDAGEGSFVYGGFLRDVVTGSEALDVDMLFTCTVQYLVDAAKEREWRYYLKQNEKTGADRTSFIALGNKAAPNKFSGHTKGAGCEGDFALNSLLYECSSGTLIDPTGTGLDDAVNKVLRIPGPRERWDDWVKEDRLHGMRAFRFFNFLSRGLQPADDETLQYITSILTEGFQEEATARPLQDTLKIFLKRKVFVRNVETAMKREERFRTSTIKWLTAAATSVHGEANRKIIEAAGGPAEWYYVNIEFYYALTKKTSIPGLTRAFATSGALAVTRPAPPAAASPTPAGPV